MFVLLAKFTLSFGLFFKTKSKGIFSGEFSFRFFNHFPGGGGNAVAPNKSFSLGTEGAMVGDESSGWIGRGLVGWTEADGGRVVVLGAK